ncbi:hypothetical protein MAR_002793 [Mya arenaria]|uniref:Uncharacterized protein n=1 Tax=Mya arenaria TaxID=6604 RepID=A0ABY7G457_MYAAR|nr:hypothetical protein MAR_002793 [Mya arenaria]
MDRSQAVSVAERLNFSLNCRLTHECMNQKSSEDNHPSPSSIWYFIFAQIYQYIGHLHLFARPFIFRTFPSIGGTFATGFLTLQWYVFITRMANALDCYSMTICRHQLDSRSGLINTGHVSGVLLLTRQGQTMYSFGDLQHLPQIDRV